MKLKFNRPKKHHSSHVQSTSSPTPLQRFFWIVRFFWRLFLAFLHVALVIMLVIAGLGVWVYHHYGKDLPDPQNIASHRSFENTRIYASDGRTLLYELVDPQGGRRTLVPFERIPTVLKEATIAVEDANFYSHPGVDMRGIIRALWLNYKHQQIVSGGSTITQQLVRNILLPPEQRGRDIPEPQLYERKVREAILSYRVSREYSKDQIFNLYLNEVYYGAQAYGIEAAAQVYFNKHVWELTPSQATLIAGLPQSPTVLNPFTNMEGARQRQRITIDLMVKNGYLTPARAEAIYAQPIELAPPTTSIVAPHFVFYVRDMLEKTYGPDLVYRGGLRVTTSIDLHWQAEAQRIAREQIASLQERNAHNAAVVMLSPQGHILAMVGSIDYQNPDIDGQVNVALAPRQPGSALKPIVYAAALQHGWTPATVIWDEPISFDNGNGTVYAPMNYDNSWHGPQRLRMALANSLNIPAVKALEFVGVQNFVRLASRMGLTTLDNPARYGLSMALGSNEVRLLDLTVAYNTLRNRGYYQPPSAILKVENSRGEVLLKPEEAGWEHQVMGHQGEQVAYLITNILSDNQARWYMFGRNNVMELPNGITAAVKTGTSNDWRDSWAMGYTPDVTVGVWVGNNDNTPMHEIAGANGAGQIWHEIMVAYYQNRVPQPFAQPDGIVQRSICAGTGTLAHESCPQTFQEYFIAGVEPSSLNVTYQTVRVAGDGTCLATAYSPPSEIREVTFTVYPEEFRDWAQRNGIPQPPTQPCPQKASSEEAVAYLAPIPPDSVVQNNQVVINGNAHYTYRLEVGAGRHPQSWVLLNQGPGGVKKGLLGVWSTTGFAPGEYTIRLQVTTPEGFTLEASQTISLQQ
jgi:1A family penicillin-binding protein